MADARVEVIRRLARRGAEAALGRAVRKSRTGAVAEAIDHLAPAEKSRVFAVIEDDEAAAEVLAQVDDSSVAAIARRLDFDRLVALLRRMETDDAARVVDALPEELRGRLLDAVGGRDRALLDDVLIWPEETAGRIMQPLPFRMSPDATCREAIEAIQENRALELVFYLYVVSDAGQLVGVVSLRELLGHPPSTRLSEIMTTDLVTVSPETDQEEVAKVVARYGLLAVPVVDEENRLLGIVTVDDILDVMREEAIEDMMLMAGVGDEAPQASVLRAAFARVRWLIFTFATGLLVSQVIARFEEPLARNLVLAGFMPVVMGMGGNVGSQAATITVRNLAIGLVRADDSVLPMLRRQGAIGLVLGAFFGVLLVAWVALRTGELVVAASIGTSIAVALANSAVMGTIVPMVLARLEADPAVATGPLVSTSIDLVTVLIYFEVATRLFGL